MDILLLRKNIIHVQSKFVAFPFTIENHSMNIWNLTGVVRSNIQRLMTKFYAVIVMNDSEQLLILKLICEPFQITSTFPVPFARLNGHLTKHTKCI